MNCRCADSPICTCEGRLEDIRRAQSNDGRESLRNIKRVFSTYRGICDAYEDVPILFFNEAEASSANVRRGPNSIVIKRRTLCRTSFCKSWKNSTASSLPPQQEGTSPHRRFRGIVVTCYYLLTRKLCFETKKIIPLPQIDRNG